MCPRSLVKTWTLHNWKISDSFWEKIILCWKRGVLPRVTLHWENYFSISFHIEWDMIVVTVYAKKCLHDHIPFNVKENGNILFPVYVAEFSPVLKLWRLQLETWISLCIHGFGFQKDMRKIFWNIFFEKYFEKDMLAMKAICLKMWQISRQNTCWNVSID